MWHILNFVTFVFSVIVFSSCKKDDNTDGCFSGITVRQISDKPAVIKVTGTVHAVYIVEQGSVDENLVPCYLPKEFIQNDLQVTISGDVKKTPQGAGPCCFQNFVITKITR